MPQNIEAKSKDLTRILLPCSLIIYVLKFGTGIAWSIVSKCTNNVSLPDACVDFHYLLYSCELQVSGLSREEWLMQEEDNLKKETRNKPCCCQVR